MSVLRFRWSFAAAVTLSSLALAPAPAAGQVERPAAVGEAAAQTSTQAAAAARNQNATETRQEFYRVLEQYPPGLGRVLRLDPTLLTNEAYLASYPKVAAFVAQYPDVPRNPGYYLERYESSYTYYNEPRDARTASLRIWQDAMNFLGAFAIVAAITIALFAVIRFAIGISPLLFLSRTKAALTTAFSTSSSSATLPTALDVAEKQLGIPRRIAGFVLPIGSTMCMNGTAIFEGITVIFLAEVFGVSLTIPQMAIVMIMSVITAIGAAGVPGGSIPLLVGILTMFGVPGEGIAIVLGVDRILDMSRTTVNVCSDLTATAWHLMFYRSARNAESRFSTRQYAFTNASR